MGFETPQETEKAEEILQANPESAGLTETRGRLLERIRELRDLDPGVFEKIVESFDYEGDDLSETIKFTIGGHKLVRRIKDGVSANFFVDDKEVSDEMNARILGKYGNVIDAIKNLDNKKIDYFKNIEDENNRARAEEALAKELGL